MNDQPEVDWVESRHRPAPSSDTPDLGPWCCYADEVGMYGDGICSPEDPRHAPTHCGYDNVRRGLVPAPSSDTPAHSGRDGLTLREAAIEAILIREQDTAFSVVARHIAALFTSLDAIPSAPPVPSEGERRPDVRDLPEWEALAEAIATRGELSTLDYRYEDDAIAFRGHLNRPAPSSPPQPDREREVAALAAIVGDLWDYPDGITRPAVYRERLAERFGDDVAKVWDRLRDGCGDETDLDRWHLADRGEPTP